AVGVRFLAYPIWLWHWGSPDDVPWTSAAVVPLDEADIAAKRAAISAHRTQTQPLSPSPGDEVMLHEGMRSHFTRDAEVLFAPAPRGAVQTSEPAVATLVPGFFDSFYARHDDPWGLDSRWYERRKRSVLTASLPRERYHRALELGCATGALTEMLAPRCDRLVAVDIAAEAVQRARERLADLDNVDVLRAEIPTQWPRGQFDLIVFSEIGYYWTAPDLELALDRMVASLTPDGQIVACHWRHPVPEHAVTGDGVHVALRTMPGLVGMAHHEEADFVLEVFARPPAPSVAELEGLTP
ncbi:MAG: SAM-dependent methyltransferase, partial [Microbacteriaceae bacterium]